MNTYEMIKLGEDRIKLKSNENELLSPVEIIKHSNKNIFLFLGEIGSGKTTLIKQICRDLGCDTMVNSPTFAIINEYEAINTSIYHLDCYRIRNLEEAINTGIVDCINTSKLCFIEWPDILIPIIDNDAVVAQIKVEKNKKRFLLIDTLGKLKDKLVKSR